MSQTLSAYGRRSDAALSVMQSASELQTRAQRKLGIMLAQTPDSKPGPKKLGAAQEPNSTPTLASIGVSKKLSAGSQRLAAIPDADFEKIIDTLKAGEKLPRPRDVQKLGYASSVPARQIESASLKVRVPGQNVRTNAATETAPAIAEPIRSPRIAGDQGGGSAPEIDNASAMQIGLTALQTDHDMLHRQAGNVGVSRAIETACKMVMAWAEKLGSDRPL